MSLGYSHPQDLHKMMKEQNQKLDKIIELLKTMQGVQLMMGGTKK